MSITGKYRIISSDNVMGELNALFNNSISAEDIAALTSPDNVATVTVVETDGGYASEINYSKVPKLNASFDIKFGEEIQLPGPFPGVNVSTRKGSVITEVVKHPDVTYTYTTTYSSYGATMKVVSSKDGYISTSIWKRVDAPLCGYYIIESTENAEKAFMADSGLSKAQVDEMLSFLAFRLTEKNGVYFMTDYLGNGTEKTMTFELGKEFDNCDAELGTDGTMIITSGAPNELVMSYKGKDPSKTSVWRGVACENMFTWTVEKPLNGVACKLTYKRYGDIFGNWRRLTHSNGECFFRHLGMDAASAKAAADEKMTLSVTPKQKGIWEVDSDSKIFKMEKALYRSGEEVTIKMAEYTIVDVATLTKDGMAGAYKIDDKTIIYNVRVGTQFMIVEEELEGRPDTRCSGIYARE